MGGIVSVVIRERDTEINFVVKQYPIIEHQFVSNFDLLHYSVFEMSHN